MSRTSLWSEVFQKKMLRSPSQGGLRVSKVILFLLNIQMVVVWKFYLHLPSGKKKFYAAKCRKIFHTLQHLGHIHMSDLLGWVFVKPVCLKLGMFSSVTKLQKTRFGRCQWTCWKVDGRWKMSLLRLKRKLFVAWYMESWRNWSLNSQEVMRNVFIKFT